ncbi:SusD/RagB family nutrient-binding outer membrane lipoprotein [Parabacteroides bouchesdurhonensis]|uniref:SusD/RagB family nutrient-binding outer membrane lipoprotein n=1 Tax=Parabacteroides bouchesdurhonensis TaxID=1936995 RepID=UPI000E539DFD|nr:SusD/RagB family nutrient-binding outer membrane lipoprotein [Parabacteroides bouchesdurhonensis]RHJ94979.1 SusD/RagB family nutrient-binding outer membrane lipoprotein [Bacteroides sp. AM07-16]
MKTFNKIMIGLASSAALLFTACSDFEDINKDPNAVSEDNVQVAHLLNKSIIGAQMNPEIAERIFVLTWKRAARFDRGSGFTIGVDNDGYNSLYFGTSYGVGWLNNVNAAINLADKRIADGTAMSYENNVLQMARIWRAYLVSELADCFGPIPIINKFDGTVAPYQSVEEIYTFILSELKDAVSKIDVEEDMSAITATNNNSDQFYQGDMKKWKKYGNSLRLRLAMRLTVVNPTLARSEFEDAAKGDLITTLNDMAQVQEKGGWTDTDGVMSRTWNSQPLSATMNNIFLGLGGVDIQVADEIKSDVKIKSATNYMGLRFDKHLPTSTNDPSAGFFYDGLPDKIDPRALTLYNIPGYNDGVVYSDYIGEPATTARLADPATGEVVDKSKKPYMELTVKYTWNTWVAGKWDKKADLSTELTGESKNYPSIAKKFRMSENKRVWFGPWETYFLLAEAAEYGWSVPGTAKSNYEAGITASFEYNGVSQFLSQYLESKDYNRVGTSVAFDHTTEAIAHEVTYIDGYTKETKTMTYTYPKNSVYKGGQFNNDHLTKIITQKYIAQNPWLPLEVWSDHRRLGLPFFENQAVEIDYNPTAHEVPLTRSTAKECKWEFYPKRMRYPSSLETNSKDSYDQAMQLLGGVNDTNNPLWWEMKK